MPDAPRGDARRGGALGEGEDGPGLPARREEGRLAAPWSWPAVGYDPRAASSRRSARGRSRRRGSRRVPARPLRRRGGPARGAGGDGAQTAAMLVTRAAIHEGFDATHIPSYGPSRAAGRPSPTCGSPSTRCCRPTSRRLTCSWRSTPSLGASARRPPGRRRGLRRLGDPRAAVARAVGARGAGAVLRDRARARRAAGEEHRRPRRAPGPRRRSCPRRRSSPRSAGARREGGGPRVNEEAFRRGVKAARDGVPGRR